jgi:hypothetical protein
VLFYVLAFFVGLPAIVLRPSKFALSVTFGSICTMVWVGVGECGWVGGWVGGWV